MLTSSGVDRCILVIVAPNPFIDPQGLCSGQYIDDGKLRARLSLHERFATVSPPRCGVSLPAAFASGSSAREPS